MQWFSAPTGLNQTLEGEEIKIEKYHEVVDMAIAKAISTTFGGSHTPRTCMSSTVAAVLHKTHRKWRVDKEMKGCGMEGRLVLLPFVDGGGNEVVDE